MFGVRPVIVLVVLAEGITRLVQAEVPTFLKRSLYLDASVTASQVMVAVVAVVAAILICCGLAQPCRVVKVSLLHAESPGSQTDRI